MSRVPLAAAMLALLAACGVEGPPNRPEPVKQTGGLTVSGTAKVGVVVQ